MTTVRLLLALVAGLVLAAPSALAAPARGELEVGSVLLAPDATLEAAGLDLRSFGEGIPTLDLQLTDVSIHRLGRQNAYVDPGLAPTEATTGDIDERREYAAARILLERGTGDQLVALRSEGPATATVGGAEVRGVGGALLGSALPVGGACGEAQGDYCLDVFGVYQLAGDTTTAALTGPITLLLYGPTLIVEQNGERTTLSSGLSTAQDATVAQQTEDAWIRLTGTATAGGISGDGLRLYSAAPTLRSSSVTLHDADGGVRVGLNNYRATSEDVEATGAIVLTPGPVARAEDNGISTSDFASEPVYASSFPTRVSGDIASIDLDGAPAFLDTPAERAGAAALALAIAGGIAYAWNHLAFFVAALYTRLNKPDILENDVRNRIYDIIVNNPGISAREVHRQSEQSWGTVVYHLRQLERHHLVVSRALGRTRNYYENHGKYRGMEVQLACLQSDRALALAREIAAMPGITQEQLAEKCHFPQPTTSYYVRKLKQAGLVEEQREGRYVKYVPHADLPRFIALSSHEAQIGTTAASGVQA